MRAAAVLGLCLLCLPAAASADSARAADPYGHPYAFGPEGERADWLAPWERSGFAFALGLGSQFGGYGGQVGYEWVPPETRFTLEPYVAGGVLTGEQTDLLPGFAVGAMAMYGRGWRWVLDLGFGAHARQSLVLFGSYAADRVLYAAHFQLGQQWTNRSGVFVRWLIGGGWLIDRYVEPQALFSLGLALGWKP